MEPIHAKCLQWALDIALDNPEDWTYETLFDEALSYMRVLHTDIEGALINLGCEKN